jgi:hypothetical protein
MMNFQFFSETVCGLCSFEEEVAFAGVAGEGGGVGEFGAGFGVAVEFGEEVASYAG